MGPNLMIPLLCVLCWVSSARAEDGLLPDTLRGQNVFKTFRVSSSPSPSPPSANGNTPLTPPTPHCGLTAGASYATLNADMRAVLDDAKTRGYPVGEGNNTAAEVSRELSAYLNATSVANGEDVLIFFDLYKAWSGFVEWTQLMNMQYPDYHPIPVFEDDDKFMKSQLKGMKHLQNPSLVRLLNLEKLIEATNGGSGVNVAIIDQFEQEIVNQQLPGVTVTHLDGPTSDHGNDVIDTFLAISPNATFSLWSAQKNITEALEMVSGEESVDIVNQSQGWVFTSFSTEEEKDQYRSSLLNLSIDKLYFKSLGNEGVSYREGHAGAKHPYWTRPRPSGSIGSDDADNIPMLVANWTTSDTNRYNIVFSINYRSDLGGLFRSASAPGTLEPVQRMSIAGPGTRYFEFSNDIESGSSYVSPIAASVSALLLRYIRQVAERERLGQLSRSDELEMVREALLNGARVGRDVSGDAATYGHGIIDGERSRQYIEDRVTSAATVQPR